MSRTIYTQEFKKTIVELLESGKSVKELSIEFNVSQSSIKKWRKDFNMTDFEKQESAKIKALEKELKNVKLERDILKKAVSIFSKSDK